MIGLIVCLTKFIISTLTNFNKKNMLINWNESYFIFILFLTWVLTAGIGLELEPESEISKMGSSGNPG